MRDDLRFAARILRRNPGFAILAIVVLAVGIGSNAALFGIIDGTLLRPLRLDEPDRLVQVERVRADGYRDSRFTASEFEAIGSGAADSFQGIVAVWDARREAIFVVGDIERPVRVRGARVSPGFFTILGARFAIGRGFDELRRGGGDRRVAVLSYGLWQSIFQADSAIVGRTVLLNGEPHRVTGVLSSDVDLPGPQGAAAEPGAATELWAPLPHERVSTSGQDYDRLIARLRPNVRREVAEQEVARVLTAASDDPAAMGIVRLVPLHDRVVGESRTALLLLFAVLGVILLLTCVNLAGLQLARTLRRRPEIAIRSALGAVRGRLARQYLVEGSVLAGVGGTVGLLAAVWIQRLFLAWAPSTLPRPAAAHIGLRAFAFTIAVTALAAIVCSLSPVIEAARPDATRNLKQGHGAIGRAGRRLRKIIAGSQIALAVVLLSGSALLVTSLSRLQSVDIGFDATDIHAIDLYRETLGSGATGLLPYYADVLAQVRKIPGVRGATLASSIPARHRDYYAPAWRTRIVSHGYFELLGIPLLEGRTVAPDDPPGGQHIAVVNETLARQEFGSDSPIGQLLDDLLIVGVVADTRHESADRVPQAAVYEPLGQRGEDRLTLLVRSSLDPASLSGLVSARIHALDGEQPVAAPIPLNRIVAESPAMAERAFYFRLLGVLSIVALTLAVMGVYGVMAQLVADRTREYGVRIALGASPAQIGRYVLRRAIPTIAGGVSVGLLAAHGLTLLLGSLLYRLGLLDLTVALAVGLSVVGAAIAAAWVPSRRATRVSPIVAIQAE